MASLNSLSCDQARGGLVAKHWSSQILATFIQKEQKLGASSTKLDSQAHVGPSLPAMDCIACAGHRSPQVSPQCPKEPEPRC